MKYEDRVRFVGALKITRGFFFYSLNSHTIYLSETIDEKKSTGGYVYTPQFTFFFLSLILSLGKHFKTQTDTIQLLFFSNE